MSPSSRHLVDPQLLPFLQSFPELKLSTETLPALRNMPVQFAPDMADLERTRVELCMISGPGGAPPVPIRIYEPISARTTRPAILHIHGGGFVMGSSALLEARLRFLCADLDCLIVSVDYRLAPETRYPGAIEDCYAALSWMWNQRGQRGIDDLRIGVMGESAGGGLAAALALLVRDRGEFFLAFQHLTYPMLDDRTCMKPDAESLFGEFIWTPQSNRFGWESLLGHEPGRSDVSAYAAPGRATNLANLPETFVAVGALDLFAEENLDYARRLMESGVAVELHVYPGAFHAFDLMPDACVSQQARRDSRNALARMISNR